jgi:hypothetical protein
MEKTVTETKDTEIRSKTYEGGPTTVGEEVDHEFTMTETGVDKLVVDLDWPTPDDFDLEVYRKRSDGSLQEVGSSGNAPGDKERVEIAGPAAGDYVLRVINFAAASPTYTLTAALMHQEVVSSNTVPGQVERWTLTCERKGTVLQRLKVRVDRGDLARVDLSECRRRW